MLILRRRVKPSVHLPYLLPQQMVEPEAVSFLEVISVLNSWETLALKSRCVFYGIFNFMMSLRTREILPFHLFRI